MAGSNVDDDSIVGDECHIVSASRNGPRYDPALSDDLVDDHSNLLLLCKVHHKLVDDQQSKYTSEFLKKLKSKHEGWVSDQLDSSGPSPRPVRVRQVPENIPKVFPRIRSGKEVLDIVTDALAYAPAYDELRNKAEDQLVAGFLQEAQDWGELGLESVSDTMHAARRLDEHVRELEKAGFWVFGCREKQVLEGGNGLPRDWPVAHLRVLRTTNPEIIDMDDGVKQGKVL